MKRINTQEKDNQNSFRQENGEHRWQIISTDHQDLYGAKQYHSFRTI